MFASITQLYMNVRSECPGVTDPMIDMEFFNAMDEFCRRTDGNRYSTPIPLVEGVTSYIVTYPDNVVIRVYSITHRTLDTTSAWYDPDDGSLALGNPPVEADLAEPLYLNVSLAPKAGVVDSDAWMPELLYDRFYIALLDGTISKLAAQIAKPWTNQVKATYHGRRFRRLMADYKAQAEVGFAPNAQAWRFPQILLG